MVGLIVLRDVRVCWNGLPLDCGLCVLLMCTEDWLVGLAPLLLSVCAAFAYICPLQASGHWCVVVVCTGGCEGTYSPCVPVFGVCWVFPRLCWLGVGLHEWTWMSGCSIDMEHLSALIYIYTLSSSISY